MSAGTGQLPGAESGLRRVSADFGPIYAANGFIGLLFAATGATAIILSVGTGAHLPASELVTAAPFVPAGR